MTVYEDFEFDPNFDACCDCGGHAWRQHESGREVHEDFYVHDELWDRVCPDDEVVEWVEAGVTFRHGKFVMCIGCFEKRLGRQLTREDFKAPPNRLFGVPHPTGSGRGGRLEVRVRGFEPPRPFGHRDLNPARIPSFATPACDGLFSNLEPQRWS